MGLSSCGRLSVSRASRCRLAAVSAGERPSVVSSFPATGKACVGVCLIVSLAATRCLRTGVREDCGFSGLRGVLGYGSHPSDERQESVTSGTLEAEDNLSGF